MTTELPSINSATSISDNADLKNHYENLLFKNNSGRSLVDLPRRQEFSQQQHEHQHQQGTLRSNDQLQDHRCHGPQEGKDINGSNAGLDFINGFFQTPTSEPIVDSSASVTSTNNQAVAIGQREQQQGQQDALPARSLFYAQDPMGSIGGFTLDFDRNVGRDSSAGNDTSTNYIGYPKQSLSPGTMVSSLNAADPFFDNPPIFQQYHEPLEARKQQYLGARRSSYISDTLIHGHLGPFIGGALPPPPPSMRATAANMVAAAAPPPPTSSIFPGSLEGIDTSYPLGTFANSVAANSTSIPPAAGTLGGSHLSDASEPTSQVRPLTTAPAVVYGGFLQPQMAQQLPPRRNTQPVNSLAVPPASAPLNSRNRFSNFAKSNQQSQQQQQQQQQQQSQKSQHQSSRQSQQQHVSPLQGETASAINASSVKGNMQVSLDNGLILVNGHKIASSPDLQALYLDCGSKYFSGPPVYEFTDYIKSMLIPTTNNGGDSKKQAISKFLAFLKSCNLNYNPQSNAFVSGEKQPQLNGSNKNIGAGGTNGNCSETVGSTTTIVGTQERRGNTASSYLHYKPLVLVSLKNGKLELLSTPQNTNISMKRGDLVIIDGDRGKDLALVVEPVVDLDLALFVNFLKKKIHFDSLITSRSQHHPNNKFISSLVQSTKGENDELNAKLYDVIELTQLIVPSKQVLRFATPWEITTNLHNKFQDELKALHIAQLKLKSLNSGFSHHHHSHGHGHSHVNDHSAGSNNNENNNNNGSTVGRPQLNIKILNAEFQFDRKKLTFYYFCEERNDFRELIKELFKFYKTRIWLCAIPNNLGIDQKYYDSQRKELKMYQEMMQHYATEDLADANTQQGAGFIVAPPLNRIELDNFQIGVYKELIDELFGN